MKKGTKHSEETKQKMSLAHDGFTGRHHSEATKKQISEKLKGRKIPPEVLKKRIGRKFSEEHKRNIGLAHKGLKRSAETRLKMSLSQKGKHLSEATKKKLSEYFKGKKTGKDSPMWKGGLQQHKAGYIWEYSPNHPLNHKGNVLQHRLVMEQKLGRFLKPEEVVHHINGDGADNRIENLVLFANNKEHMLFHKRRKNEN